MRTETETVERRARPLPDLDAEQEVDLGRYGRSVASRWWLVLAAVVVGALAGWLYTVAAAREDTYRARATVFLGNPISPTGGAQLNTFATNPGAVPQLARSDEVVQDVAAEVGIRARRLEGAISARPVGTPIGRQGETSLVEITVRGPWGERTADAANLVAAEVVERASGYVDDKVEALEAQIAEQERELEALERRIGELEQAAERGGLSSVERLTLLNLIGLNEQRRGDLVEDRTATQQLLSVAENVERSRVVTEARAVKVDPRESKTAVVVGGFIGLLAGIVLALLWEPLVARRRPA